jgi:hypothetical protein
MGGFQVMLAHKHTCLWEGEEAKELKAGAEQDHPMGIQVSRGSQKSK